jgi:hypothetical protein
MSADVIAAVIGASATVCVTCVPVLFKLHRMSRASRVVLEQSVVMKELTTINRAHMEYLSVVETFAEKCITMLLEDVLSTYTKNLVALLYEESLKRASKRDRCPNKQTNEFQSLLAHSGNGTTLLLLQKVETTYEAYYVKIKECKGLAAQVRFLVSTYEYFVIAASSPIIHTTDLVIYNVNAAHNMTINYLP